MTVFDQLFPRKKVYINIPAERRTPTVKPIASVEESLDEVVQSPKELPNNLIYKCPRCTKQYFTKEFEKNEKVCPACNFHGRLNAIERIQITLDEGTFEEYQADMVSVDPLNFPGYKEKYAKHQLNTGFRDAIITGQGEITGNPVIIAAMSFEFFGGSMGSVVGEKIAYAIEQAIHSKHPLIIFSTSGGARMEESILSLMQMAKTSALLSQLAEERGLFISVLTDPTLGGVSASFAMLGDVNIAEPGAIVGFTGRRVIEQTIRQKLPDNFQTSEFNLKHGQLDMVVHRQELKSVLGNLLDMHRVTPSVVEGF